MKFKPFTSAKRDKKLARKKRFNEWWFKLWTCKKIHKYIVDFLYAYRDYSGDYSINKIFMLPEDFKKYSNKDIEHALIIFKQSGILEHWERKTLENQDGYLLIMATENRPQARFSKRYMQEINLNDIRLEPAPQAEPLKQEISNPEQTPQEELPAEKMIDARQPVHAESHKRSSNIFD